MFDSEVYIMSVAIQIFQIIFYSVAIIFMLTLTILSIWGFILYNKNSKNMRINNYILEKLYQSINKLVLKNIDMSNKELDSNLDDNFNND